MLALGPAIADSDVVTLNIAGFAQALAERPETACQQIRRKQAEKPVHRHGRLRRPPPKRPGTRTGSKGDEIRWKLFELHLRPLPPLITSRYSSICRNASCTRMGSKPYPTIS